MTDLPDEIQVWHDFDTLTHSGTWSTTRYPPEAVTYVPKADLAQARADAEAAVALALQEAAKQREFRDHSEGEEETEFDRGYDQACDECATIIRALAPASAIAEVEKLRAERDEWKRLAIAGELTARHLTIAQTELAALAAENQRLRDRERVLVGALINRDGGSHDEDCKARRYGNRDRLCNCGHDEVVAALATDDSAKAGGVSDGV